jgi:hypothetical protein
MPRNKKHIPGRAGQIPDLGKNPRAVQAVNYDSMKITWRLALIDKDGPWCFSKKITLAKLWEIVLDKCKNFESMTWDAIKKAGSHAVPVDQLIPDAQRRLAQINQNDIDELFSLRVSGAERIWGIRDQAALKVLWWDPEHKICPSQKKHT